MHVRSGYTYTKEATNDCKITVSCGVIIRGLKEMRPVRAAWKLLLGRAGGGREADRHQRLAQPLPNPLRILLALLLSSQVSAQARGWGSWR